MLRKRKQFTAAFKAKVALEAVKGEKSISEIASCHKIHPTQIIQWKRKFLQCCPTAFASGREKEKADKEELIDELYRQIGVLKVEVDWLKKKSQEFN